MNKNSILALLFFGTIWGFLEATVGGLMHTAGIPLAGTVMSSIGFAILFVAMRSGLRPVLLVLVALVAASFKFFDVFLFSLPVVHHHIINPATAIASQGLAFALIFRRAEVGGLLELASRMFASVIVAALVFNALSAGVYNIPSYHAQNPLFAVAVELPLVTFLSVLFSKASCLISAFKLSASWQTACICSFTSLGAIARFYLK